MPFFRSSRNRVLPTHAPADGFSDVAHASGARSAYVEQWSFSGDWAVRYPGSKHAVVHCMVVGSAVVDGLGDAPVTIPEGGMLLLPRDVPHTVASRLPVDDANVIEHEASLPAGTVHNFAASEAPTARLLTLPYDVPALEDADTPEAADHAVVERPEADVVEIVLLASKLVLMPGVGDRYVAARLAEAILGKVLVRAAGAQDDRFGLFGMFASLGVRSALKAIEGDVAHGWTVGELAEIAGLPRSAFKTEFRAAMGLSVPEYLGLRRVRRCEHMLAEGMTAVAEAATAAGFRSQSSFLAAARKLGRESLEAWTGGNS
ncbi:MAG: AraC family transcriptional regulator [Myxococcota bacterium]